MIIAFESICEKAHEYAMRQMCPSETINYFRDAFPRAAVNSEVTDKPQFGKSH